MEETKTEMKHFIIEILLAIPFFFLSFFVLIYTPVWMLAEYIHASRRGGDSKSG